MDKRCCVCGRMYEGYGNNPSPIPHRDEERCCDDCNRRYVIPIRIIEGSAKSE